MKMPITSNIRQTMNKQISKGMRKDIQNIARKKKEIFISRIKNNSRDIHEIKSRAKLTWLKLCII